MKTFFTVIIIISALVAGLPAFAADFDKGMDAYDKGDYDTALAELRPLAEQGHAAAQNSLGVTYEYGNGVLKDNKEAVKWYTLAAEQGIAAAQNNLRVACKDHGALKDNKEVMKWYTLAVEQGDAEVQFKLGEVYRKGEDIGYDREQAVKWYTLAAEQGHADAQYNLGRMYHGGYDHDREQAVKWYTLAAEQGHATAQFKLGEMYRRGYDKNNKEAVKWYILAAEQGHVDAQYNLGWMYREGKGVLQDDVRAHMWCNIAASNGEELAADFRDTLATLMTPEQITQAEALYRQCVAKNYKGC